MLRWSDKRFLIGLSVLLWVRRKNEQTFLKHRHTISDVWRYIYWTGVAKMVRNPFYTEPDSRLGLFFPSLPSLSPHSLHPFSSSSSQIFFILSHPSSSFPFFFFLKWCEGCCNRSGPVHFNTCNTPFTLFFLLNFFSLSHSSRRECLSKSFAFHNEMLFWNPKDKDPSFRSLNLFKFFSFSLPSS